MGLWHDFIEEMRIEQSHERHSVREEEVISDIKSRMFKGMIPDVANDGPESLDA